MMFVEPFSERKRAACANDIEDEKKVSDNFWISFLFAGDTIHTDHPGASR